MCDNNSLLFSNKCGWRACTQSVLPNYSWNDAPELSEYIQAGSPYVRANRQVMTSEGFTTNSMNRTKFYYNNGGNSIPGGLVVNPSKMEGMYAGMEGCCGGGEAFSLREPLDNTVLMSDLSTLNYHRRNAGNRLQAMPEAYLEYNGKRTPLSNGAGSYYFRSNNCDTQLNGTIIQNLGTGKCCY